jgi:uncharacterized protein (DUF2147 family)
MRLTMMAATALLAMAPAVASAASPKGVWTNPKKSVRVVFQQCGPAMCGKVVWATPQAQSDAQARGGEPLLGAMLFRDFVEEERGRWSGNVFVPDIGQTISGTIEQIDADTLVGEGCLVAGFGCQSQTWVRVR